MPVAMPDLWLPFWLQSTANVHWPVLVSHPVVSRRLSWMKWLVTYQDSIPVNSHPSIGSTNNNLVDETI